MKIELNLEQVVCLASFIKKELEKEMTDPPRKDRYVRKLCKIYFALTKNNYKANT